jgi:hypothetical protein
MPMRIGGIIFRACPATRLLPACAHTAAASKLRLQRGIFHMSASAESDLRIMDAVPIPPHIMDGVPIPLCKLVRVKHELKALRKIRKYVETALVLLIERFNLLKITANSSLGWLNQLNRKCIAYNLCKRLRI